MEQREKVLSIRGLVTSFDAGRKKPRAVAVNGVNLDVRRGEVVGLVGESGCGKSMTAMSVMGLLPDKAAVTGGEILLDGENLLAKSARELREMKGRRLSVIFQEPMTSLNPVLTVGRQVGEMVRLHEKSLSRAEIHARVREIFEKVGIPEPEKRMQCYPHQLSGGLRQRVMIGMAMILKPELMIADEPTTALDVTIEAQILRLMKALCAENDTSILLITHNLGVVAEICDTVYVMYAGEIVECADVFTLFKCPTHPYTRGLIAAMPSTRKSGEPLYNIRGMVPNLNSMPSGCRFSPRCEFCTEACRADKPELRDIGGGHLVRCFHTSEEAGE